MRNYMLAISHLLLHTHLLLFHQLYQQVALLSSF